MIRAFIKLAPFEDTFSMAVVLGLQVLHNIFFRFEAL